MARPLLLCLMALLMQWPSAALAQSNNDSRFNLMTPGLRQWFPGWYITLQGDTIKGYIYLSNQIDNQQLFKYSPQNPPAAEVKTMDAKTAKGYRVKDRVYESLYSESDASSTTAFVRRTETGRLNLYAWFSIPEVGTVHDGVFDRPITATDEKFHESVSLIRTGTGQIIFTPEPKDFPKVMSLVVEDNPEMASRISQKLKGYRSGDLLNIVQEYNAWYLKQQ